MLFYLNQSREQTINEHIPIRKKHILPYWTISWPPNYDPSSYRNVCISFYSILTSLSKFLIGNSAGFESLIETMQQLIEDVSDPGSQKVAVIFLSRCVTVWGRETNQTLPGFDRFIYERLVPTAFRVPSLPGFNIKDGQMMVVSLF